MANSIVVIGSLNMDFVLAVDRLPLPGETILGRDFRTIPGGKGANQAYAAAKLASGGTLVRMMGRIGADSFGKALKENLADVGVDVRAVLETDSEATGVACIHVDDAGQNSITVAPGANGVLSAGDIDAERSALDGARCVLLQLEVPMEAVAEGLREARRVGAIGILDPAPARALRKDILELVDIATPNENEACVLAGVPPSRVNARRRCRAGKQDQGTRRAGRCSEAGRSGLRVLWRGPNIRRASLSRAGHGFHRGRRHVQRGAGGCAGGRRGHGTRTPVRKRRGGDFSDSSRRADFGAAQGGSGFSARGQMTRVISGS